MYFNNEEDLKNYILDQLFNKTYRDLIQDNKFKTKTGIKSLGTLTYYTKKLNINIEKVYERAKLKNRIRHNCSYEEFLRFTKRENVINKIKHDNKIIKARKKERIDALINIGNMVGYEFNNDDKENENYIMTCLLDFFSKDDIEKMVNEYINNL